MNTASVLRELLHNSGLPLVTGIEDLVGIPVGLRIQTGGDAYDIVGTTIASARMRLDGNSRDPWIELTFPPIPIAGKKSKTEFTLVRARRYVSVAGWRFYAVGQPYERWWGSVYQKEARLEGWLESMPKDAAQTAA